MTRWPRTRARSRSWATTSSGSSPTSCSTASRATSPWTGQHREAARARMRVLVKRILRKYGYPPDLQDAAVQTVLQQAEVLSAEVGGMTTGKKQTKTRSYAPRTLKILFALSGNQCAHPDCKNPVIVPPTEESDALVLNQICHIYALSEDGPRGKAGLTAKELNAPDNLILFCPTHHTIIDGQHETYPAVLLQQWKKTHETEIQKRLPPI